jgi:hypothetical protein
MPLKAGGLGDHDFGVFVFCVLQVVCVLLVRGGCSRTLCTYRGTMVPHHCSKQSNLNLLHTSVLVLKNSENLIIRPTYGGISIYLKKYKLVY